MKEYYQRIIIALGRMKEYYQRVIVALGRMKEYYQRIIVALGRMKKYYQRMIIAFGRMKEYFQKMKVFIIFYRYELLLSCFPLSFHLFQQINKRWEMVAVTVCKGVVRKRS